MSTDYSSDRITLARLPSGRTVTTTLHEFAGDLSGPTVYCHAAVHGREINGVEVCRRVVQELKTTDIRGTVKIVPIANPLTFDLQRYTVPPEYDETHLWTANMEQAWPGDENGRVHERMAARLWEEVQGADSVIDLHTGIQNTHPHMLYTESKDTSRELATVFGTDLVMPSSAKVRTPDWPTNREKSGTLRAVADDEGIPSIIAELSNAHLIEKDPIEIGVIGVLNVFRHLDVLDGDVVDNGERLLAYHDRDSGSYPAADSGLFVRDPDVRVGTQMESGQHLGDLYHPTDLEKISDVVIEEEGMLYYLRDRGTVPAGERLAAVAYPQD